MNKGQRLIRSLLDQAHGLAMLEIEHAATRILQQNPSLVSFMMAMGSCFFVNRAGETIDPDERKYMAPIQTLLDQFNRELYLTGTPIRLDKRDGLIHKTHDW